MSIRVWVHVSLWFVILFGIINLGAAEREAWAGHRLPSSPNCHSVFILRSSYANSLKAASSLMLLYITQGSLLVQCLRFSFIYNVQLLAYKWGYP